MFFILKTISWIKGHFIVSEFREKTALIYFNPHVFD